jgi:catechol 2,3-dioxygenase-like lactoylglutathione lyase family enzyme
MATFANDHIAVRVADMDRATRFYTEVFDGEILTNPFVIEGDFAAAMMGGVPGARFKIRQLRFEGGVVELFEFLNPKGSTIEPVAPMNAPILHIGFQVDDVDAVAARVEREGGKLLLPVTEWGAYKLTFCADPDGNIIELADTSIHKLVEATKDAFPEARPDANT